MKKQKKIIFITQSYFSKKYFHCQYEVGYIYQKLKMVYMRF